MLSSLSERAAIIPGGSMTRSKKIFGRWASHAEGAIITDVDGNDYIDMGCGLGAISLGYKPRQLYGSGVCTLPYAVEIEAAEVVLKHVAPWASHVRFTKTGSEATHAAYRIAKAATGRSRVLVAKGAYHGWHEWCERADQCEHIEYSNARLCVVDPSIDAEDVAAVFVEPRRFSPMTADELRSLKIMTERWGALLVFDEMIWGGRWALGGCTEYHGVTPDLACFGKAFGNGQSVAFVVGRDALRDHGEIVSGTFSGDSIGLQSLCDTLETYISEPVIQTMWDRARQLRGGFSMMVPKSFASLSATAPLMGITYANPEHKLPFVEAMAQRGVLTFGGWLMTCYAHTPEHIERVVEACADAAKSVTRGT